MRWVIIILGLAFPLVGNAQEVDQVEKSKGIEHITEVFNRLNPVLVKYHLTPLTFTPSDVLVFHPHNGLWNINVCEFQTLNAALDFLPDSFELISFDRMDIKYDQGPGFDQPPQPKWSQEQAVATAKEYLTAIFGEFPKDVGPPTIEFEKRRNEVKHTGIMKYFIGNWHIRWPRFDAEGHAFNADSITIDISEDQGVTTAFFNFSSKYQAPQGPLISRAEALQIASPVAQTLVDKWLGQGLQLGVPTKIVEGVVNPNHILQAKTISDLAPKDTTARLAWVIIYDLIANGVPAKGHRIYVEVDAQTKEVIGGDLH